jgi:hypothetical protein
MTAYDLAALVLDVLFGLVEFVVGRVLCEGDLACVVSKMARYGVS